MMYFLSALPPAAMPQVLQKVKRVLRPGGKVLFRDYAQFDLAQMRFCRAKGHKLDESLYVRGDGTLAYFFEKAELAALFEQAGFVVAELEYDRRLLVNRQRRVQMHRMWLQGRFVSQSEGDSPESASRGLTTCASPPAPLEAAEPSRVGLLSAVALGLGVFAVAVLALRRAR
eukprot:TRINITY_DN6622_c0_g1_i5.p2 TRINITY_DN6622_c0_g1~~TRINITY_DN6622_c0_g1_i5.p2  ORF type:complete len:172 (-),score=39.07 TRINITY_DN6622_c0_g1_i5:5-520(-)